MKVYVKRLNTRLSQKVFGELETIVEAELTNDFIKKVAEISDGNVFFERDVEGDIRVRYGLNAYYKAREKLVEIIDAWIEEQVEKTGSTKFKLTAEAIDLNEFKKECERAEEKVREEQRRYELKEKIRARVEQLVKEKSSDLVKFEPYHFAEFTKVTVIFVPESVEVDEIVIKYDEESIMQFEEYDTSEALTRYIHKLRDEKKEIEDELNNLKDKHNTLVNFIRERELHSDLLDYLTEQREKAIAEEIEEEFSEIFDYDC